MQRPWMPLYVGDFIADTMHLGATETGIYIRLIFHCWQHGTIPTDIRKVCLISHCDTRLWHQYAETVLQFFDVVDASTMHHKRVTSERLRTEELSNKRKSAALQKHSNSSAIAQQNTSYARASPQPQSQLHLERKKDSPANAGSSKYAFEDGVIRLNQRDFDNWQAAYKNLDLAAELLSLSQWASTERENWFHAVKGALAKRNRAVRAIRDAPPVSRIVDGRL